MARVTKKVNARDLGEQVDSLLMASCSSTSSTSSSSSEPVDLTASEFDSLAQADVTPASLAGNFFGNF